MRAAWPSSCRPVMVRRLASKTAFKILGLHAWFFGADPDDVMPVEKYPYISGGGALRVPPHHTHVFVRQRAFAPTPTTHGRCCAFRFFDQRMRIHTCRRAVNRQPRSPREGLFETVIRQINDACDKSNAISTKLILITRSSREVGFTRRFSMFLRFLEK